MAAVDPRQRQNPAVIDRHRRALAHEMLLELPFVETTQAALASMLKMMFHSGIYEIYDRTGVQSIHVTNIQAESLMRQIIGFSISVLSSVPMLIWGLSQTAVLASRALEIVGVFSGAFDKTLRWKILFIAAIAVALLVPAVGIGNPRYRAPAEPVLILLLVQGLHTTVSWAGRLLARFRNAESTSD